MDPNIVHIDGVIIIDVDVSVKNIMYVIICDEIVEWYVEYGEATLYDNTNYCMKKSIWRSNLIQVMNYH